MNRTLNPRASYLASAFGFALVLASSGCGAPGSEASGQAGAEAGQPQAGAPSPTAKQPIAEDFDPAAGPKPGQGPGANPPSIVVIWGDDIGQSKLRVYSRGLMGYRAPNIDRIAHKGLMLTDYRGEQSYAAGRSAFVTGQSGSRTGHGAAATVDRWLNGRRRS